MKKKSLINICLVTWFQSVNYGTCIQCYALSKFLQDEGYNVYVPESYKYYYGIEHPVDTLKKIIIKIRQKISNPNEVSKFSALSENIKKDYEIRCRKNMIFSYTENNVFKFKNKKDFKKMIEITDIFITGSDQIWNPSYVTPPFLLAFAPDDKKKIAYASSFGVDNLTEKQRRVYKYYLKRYEEIGVREHTGALLLSEILERRVCTVLDPTFLLNRDRWADIAAKSKKPIENDPFVFCYFIGENSSWLHQIERIANLKNWNVIIALSESHEVPQKGKIVANAGVEDFIYYIKESRFVASDSFHAMALSINMNKEFVAYKRFSDESKDSQNSRVYDMLKMYNLENRIIDSYQQLEINTDEMIDYRQVNDILKVLRDESVDFLHDAIEKSLEE